MSQAGWMGLRQKLERLEAFIGEKGGGGALVALSGGVDSSALTAICRKVLGGRVVAATSMSAIHPREEVEDAKRVAEEVGVKHVLVETRELQSEDFLRNPEDRCYFCKKELLRALREAAEGLGLEAIFEGTTLSDLEGHRPGFRAVAEEEGVYSPWVKAGFTKEEVRALAKAIGLSVSSKPPQSCLATRIPFGERITLERLARIEEAEGAVRRLTGARQVRVRDHGGLARIEVERGERQLFLDVRTIDAVAEELRKLGFMYVTLDLEGYRPGSMLRALQPKGP
ncbi:MAG: ATP-dependent sacrificial sulfur transferase LarE [Candidatus Nezhaarchaeota archaeon]|nr:ATP-dependent sacrificial sulfur transferase LarE [Candidatus Nezhaarchaeota archaeon]